MEEGKGIYWHQGMFMQPQHFQLAERCEQFRVKPVFDAGLPHFWGVGALEITDAAVANRTFEVRGATLIFPDRSYIEYPGNAVIAPRTFDPASIESDRPVTVYLGLKKANDPGRQVELCSDSAQAGGVATRYASVGAPVDVPDLYSDGPSAPVHTLLHVVRIFFENETANLGSYDLIPIAQLVRDGDAIRLSDSFVPPCYTLAGSETLMRSVRDLRDDLAGRVRQLQELKSPREIQKADADPGYSVFLLALRSLTRACPYLFHMTETPHVHPWLVYGALRQLIGELSVFSERIDMFGETQDGTPGLPAYSHVALQNCFARARALIAGLLNEITVGPEFLAALTGRDGFYVGELPRSFFDRRNRFYLVVRSDQDPNALVDGLLRDARLASDEDMPGLVAHALPGLELIHLSVAPQGLPRRAGSCYFRIEQMSDLWDKVEREGGIALQWLDAPDDLRAEIVILRR
ncbi:type VI secretion system protein ImpJ [Paraburkholderia caballeronis]|uniref:type VI secretion system baseplate subunit TssK n=1 Tax=Paraburkholderia caballeronis TaxID=416943 RepID=UPI0010667EB1|nr:type VI secretion system baseplate subunit TssK [Paraburkholderia caballeronis]TDV28725.1 type VI secretion system protein ImpJ [Paraburkholderia caballeronis]